MIDKGREIHSVVFNTSTLEGAELHVPLVKKFEPNGNLDFFGGSSTVCFKNKFFILGTVKNVPCILVYNMLTGTQHITFIQGMDKKNRVSFLSTVEAAPSIQVMFFHSKPKKIDAQYIVSINEFGEIEGKPVSIMAQKEKLLIDGNVTWVDEHTSLICGATGEKSSIAKGMYILEIKDGEVIRRNDYNFNDFKDFYSLLNVKTQKKIAEYLRILDDRISLLRETNETIEAIVQALFKSWFVNFDPVCAKSEGVLPDGMDEATAGFFPDTGVNGYGESCECARRSARLRSRPQSDRSMWRCSLLIGRSSRVTVK
jgi:hypothetical protein